LGGGFEPVVNTRVGSVIVLGAAVDRLVDRLEEEEALGTIERRFGGKVMALSPVIIEWRLAVPSFGKLGVRRIDRVA
jgi:hypothetical protein